MMRAMATPRLAGLDMNLLVVLDALLAERNATRAAERLGMTQPAVSRALSRLRAFFGDPLFVRAPTGLVATPHAEGLAPALRGALEQLGHVVDRAVTFEPASSKRRFTISAADLAESAVLPGLMRLLAGEAPGVDIQVRAPDDALLEQLEGGEVDLAVGIFQDAPAAFRRQTLFRDGFACLVRADHPAVADRLTLDDYVALGHILISPRSRDGGFVDRALAELGKERRVALLVPHFLVAPLVAATTDLVVTMPRSIAGRVAAGSGLRVLDPPIELPGFAISQMWHERVHDDTAHAWLRGVLLRAAAPATAPAPAPATGRRSGRARTRA
jgi:DNA-binding transcriptional LysR family regulator